MPDWRKVAAQIAENAGIDPVLFLRQIDQESGFDPAARSSAGAVGIAQIVPKYHPGVDPTDPVASLKYAADWMKSLLQEYGGNADLALAHYNGGGAAVKALMDGHPFEETTAYLGAILGPKTAEAAELSAPDTGGSTVADSGYGNPNIDRVVAAKGDPISIRVVDPEVPRKVGGVETGQMVPNPTPKYEFRFQDGTTLEVQTGEGGKRDIVGGSALGSVAKGEGKPKGEIVGTNANDQWIVRQLPDGTMSRVPNPNYRPPTTKPTIPIDVQTAHTQAQTAAANAQAARAQAAAAKTQANRVIVGGALYEKAPDGSWTLSLDQSPAAKAQAAAELAHTQAQTAEAGARIGLTGAQTAEANARTGLTGLQIQEAQQKLLPQQQLVIQKRAQTIEYVQGLLKNKQLSPEQADQYIADVNAATEAALRGTTPFEEKKQLETVQSEAATQASGLLREKMSAASSLGASLTSSALGAASHAMFRPGQTSLGVDPLREAAAYIANMGGDRSTQVIEALIRRAGLDTTARSAPPAGPAGMALAGAATSPVSPESGSSVPGAAPTFQPAGL